MEAFRAFRRGAGILIRGELARPEAGVRARLERVPEPYPQGRRFRVVWERDESAGKEKLARVEHLEPEVPEHVVQLRILTGGDGEILIRSRRVMAAG